MKLAEIQKILRSKASEKVKRSTIKFVPTANKVYGVKVGILNDILRNVRQGDFDLVVGLWENGAFEEKILAAKILGKIGKENPNKSLSLIKRFSKDISDWAVCDTLAGQGVKGIVNKKQKEIFEFAQKSILSKDLWQRRFAITLLIELKRRGFSKEKIKRLLRKAKANEEYYVKKALVRLEKELNR